MYATTSTLYNHFTLQSVRVKRLTSEKIRAFWQTISCRKADLTWPLCLTISLLGFQINKTANAEPPHYRWSSNWQQHSSLFQKVISKSHVLFPSTAPSPPYCIGLRFPDGTIDSYFYGRTCFLTGRLRPKWHKSEKKIFQPFHCH